MVYAWGKTRISSTMRITKQLGVAEHTKPIMKRGPNPCLVELPDVELRVRTARKIGPPNPNQPEIKGAPYILLVG